MDTYRLRQERARIWLDEEQGERFQAEPYGSGRIRGLLGRITVRQIEVVDGVFTLKGFNRFGVHVTEGFTYRDIDEVPTMPHEVASEVSELIADESLSSNSEPYQNPETS